MTTKIPSNSWLIEDMQRTSTLPVARFALLMGLPPSTYEKLIRENRARECHVFAAKYALIRLGLPVAIDLAPVDITHPRRRQRPLSLR